MNHPKPEEWVPYLYGESRPEVRQELKAHLRSCPECRDQMAGWRDSLQRLDAWKLPSFKQSGTLALVLKWSVAAACLVLAGFAAGRLSGGTDVAELRAQLARDLRTTMRAEVSQASADTLAAAGQQTEQMMTTYLGALQAQRTEDRRAIETAFQRLESQRTTDLASLKKELDTLAVNTDAGLRHTAAGLVELAAYRASPRASTPAGQSTTQ